jgi:hypothetical protein
MEAFVFKAALKRGIVAALTVVVLPACSGTADGGPGDPRATPEASLYGSCPRLPSLQADAPWFDENNTSSAGCAYPVDRQVCLSGVTIVAIDRYDETGDGAVGNYYAEETSLEPVPSSGITVYAPSFNPPDLRLAEGDVTDMLGTFQEFPGPAGSRFEGCRTLPEIGGAMTLRFEGGEVAPLAIKPLDLVDYESARTFIGMLVRLDNVAIAGDTTLSGGRFTAPLKVEGLDKPLEADDVPRLSNELFDLENAGLTNGSKLKSVTGVVTYFYGFKVAPRRASDLVF